MIKTLGHYILGMLWPNEYRPRNYESRRFNTFAFSGDQATNIVQRLRSERRTEAQLSYTRSMTVINAYHNACRTDTFEIPVYTNVPAAYTLPRC